MNCNVCENGLLVAPVWRIAPIGVKKERYVEFNFCPNCGRKLTTEEVEHDTTNN